MPGLTISLDFDDTFTACPELWSFFCAKADVLGHKVICVSARLNTEGNLQEMRKSLPGGVDIVLCGARPKRQHTQAEGHEIHIWIDDQPDAIVGEDSRLKAAYDEVERMYLLVQECRQQRDNAKTDAMESLNKEMASLRAEITRLNMVLVKFGNAIVVR